MFCTHVGPSYGGRWEEVGKWCASRCRLACKAHGADVGVFAVFEPAVAVWGSGAADVACLGGGGLGLGGCVCSFRDCSACLAQVDGWWSECILEAFRGFSFPAFGSRAVARGVCAGFDERGFFCKRAQFEEYVNVIVERIVACGEFANRGP